jgi:hypothetical protein
VATNKPLFAAASSSRKSPRTRTVDPLLTMEDRALAGGLGLSRFPPGVSWFYPARWPFRWLFLRLPE